jgi:RES domain
VSMTGPFYRLDSHVFTTWGWEAFADPRYRFDSATGRCRVRYAATSDEGAARERYRDTDSFIPNDHAEHYLVTLAGTLSVLDLRDEATLDALAFDDQISTGRASPWWECAHRLTDTVVGWWGPAVHGIAYRSRTTPSTSTNVAFLRHAFGEATSTPLHECADFLDRLVVGRGFTVDFAF